MRIKKQSKWWHRQDKVAVTVRGGGCGYIQYDFDGMEFG